MWSYKAIERYWCIQYLMYAYLEFLHQGRVSYEMTLGNTVRRVRMDHLGS